MRQALFHNLKVYQAMDRAVRAACVKTPEPPSHWYELCIALVLLAIFIGACVVKHSAAQHAACLLTEGK